MIIIREKKRYIGISYEVYIGDTKVKEVFVKRIKKKYNEKEFVFLINSNGEVIDRVFEYLNLEDKFNSGNTKELAATALKLLYSYSEIINKNIEEFSKNDVYYFSEFIQGISVTGNIKSFDLFSNRKNATHNLYLAAIRRYLDECNIDNKNFFEKIALQAEPSGFGMFTHAKSKVIEKYKSNKSQNTTINKYVPKYISNEEYNSIIDFIENRKTEHDERDKLIVNLMYTLGLRLGEVLGITLEDIKTNNKNPNAGFLCIRNRLSDKKYQLAKTCYKPKSNNEYESGIYKEKNVGYQRVVLAPRLMQEVLNYREHSRDIFNLSERKIENIHDLAKADCVEKNNEENYYLFLNKNGTPLSSAGWNKILKKVFKEVGIEIDTNFKKDNLSHRFRHGFAMFLIEVEGKDITYVKEMMRHRSISSTLKYFNPHEDKILSERERIQENMRVRMEGKK